MERRTFLKSAAVLAAPAAEEVMTVRGPVAVGALGVTLAHEHLFSNFGEAPEEPGRYDEQALLAAVVPYAKNVKSLGCGTIIDGTAAWFGRAPLLLKKVSEQTGLHIVTNTGYYGAAEDRYVPETARKESADEIAARWVREWEKGIGGTGIRPGFVKLGVDGGVLSELDRKLVTAGARAHRRTGLTLAVHTGENAEAALEQLAVLKREGVQGEAWVWIHANKVADVTALKQAAESGAWISLDGLDAGTLGRHVELAQLMKEWGRLGQVLLSHDGNSYRAGGKRLRRDYTALFTDLLPLLEKSGFSGAEVRAMTERNPGRAYGVRRRVR